MAFNATRFQTGLKGLMEPEVAKQQFKLELAKREVDSRNRALKFYMDSDPNVRTVLSKGGFVPGKDGWGRMTEVISTLNQTKQAIPDAHDVATAPEESKNGAGAAQLAPLAASAGATLPKMPGLTNAASATPAAPTPAIQPPPPGAILPAALAMPALRSVELAGGPPPAAVLPAPAGSPIDEAIAANIARENLIRQRVEARKVAAKAEYDANPDPFKGSIEPLLRAIEDDADPDLKDIYANRQSLVIAKSQQETRSTIAEQSANAKAKTEAFNNMNELMALMSSKEAFQGNNRELMLAAQKAYNLNADIAGAPRIAEDGKPLKPGPKTESDIRKAESAIDVAEARIQNWQGRLDLENKKYDLAVQKLNRTYDLGRARLALDAETEQRIATGGASGGSGVDARTMFRYAQGFDKKYEAAIRKRDNLDQMIADKQQLKDDEKTGGLTVVPIDEKAISLLERERDKAQNEAARAFDDAKTADRSAREMSGGRLALPRFNQTDTVAPMVMPLPSEFTLSPSTVLGIVGPGKPSPKATRRAAKPVQSPLTKPVAKSYEAYRTTMRALGATDAEIARQWARNHPRGK